MTFLCEDRRLCDLTLFLPVFRDVDVDDPEQADVDGERDLRDSVVLSSSAVRDRSAGFDLNA